MAYSNTKFPIFILINELLEPEQFKQNGIAYTNASITNQFQMTPLFPTVNINSGKNFGQIKQNWSGSYAKVLS